MKTRGSGAGPMKKPASTRTGATNSATCAAEPMAMLTDRSIWSLRATSTATQCSAALPTIATTTAPMKNSDSPSDSEAACDRSDEHLGHHSDQDRPRRRASPPTCATDQPQSPLLLVGGIETPGASCSENKQPEDVGRRSARPRLQSGDHLHRRAEIEVARRRRRGSPRPSTSWNTAGTANAAAAEHQHRGSGRSRSVRLKRCPSRPRPPTSIAAPSTSRMLPMIDPIRVALTSSWRPSAEREQGDDQLRRVAEGDVQETADPPHLSARPAPRWRGP